MACPSAFSITNFGGHGLHLYARTTWVVKYNNYVHKALYFTAVSNVSDADIRHFVTVARPSVFLCLIY